HTAQIGLGRLADPGQWIGRDAAISQVQVVRPGGQAAMHRRRVDAKRVRLCMWAGAPVHGVGIGCSEAYAQHRAIAQHQGQGILG
ncbi:hypothetical protein RZS08_09410, partial [Arthrospira platensis SPKY1]|nr:hypothetical protein [Arthrospira platensis SPKY1]